MIDRNRAALAAITVCRNDGFTRFAHGISSLRVHRASIQINEISPIESNTRFIACLDERR